jgi:peptide-methionine (R)-S-oxide reductase
VPIGRANVNVMDTARSDTQDVSQLTDKDWRDRLDADAYDVLRNAATEAPFTGKFLDLKDDGIYHCAGCGAPLFSSETKFDSHCGWPSFYEKLDSENIINRTDTSHGTVRTEVLCRNCGGHLGHVFEDGPNPTGLRYCINSVALGFKPNND